MSIADFPREASERLNHASRVSLADRALMRAIWSLLLAGDDKQRGLVSPGVVEIPEAVRRSREHIQHHSADAFHARVAVRHGHGGRFVQSRHEITFRGFE